MINNFKGWKFPIIFNKYSRTVETTNSLNESIKDSLYILLTTIWGERILELDYGCGLNTVAFKNLDINLKTFISNNIKSVITNNEDRIDVLQVDINDVDDGILAISIEYIIRSNNEKDTLNFTYSF